MFIAGYSRPYMQNLQACKGVNRQPNFKPLENIETSFLLLLFSFFKQSSKFPNHSFSVVPLTKRCKYLNITIKKLTRRKNSALLGSSSNVPRGACLSLVSSLNILEDACRSHRLLDLKFRENIQIALQYLFKGFLNYTAVIDTRDSPAILVDSQIREETLKFFF